LTEQAPVSAVCFFWNPQQDSGKEAVFAKWKWKPLRVPPRPELIRDRYAKFFKEQSRFLKNYKELYLAAMNKKFDKADNRRPVK